ncbi:MAG: hypothetical protein ACR2FI_11480, partial [Burkholderiales bacterium]
MVALLGNWQQFSHAAGGADGLVQPASDILRDARPARANLLPSERAAHKVSARISRLLNFDEPAGSLQLMREQTMRCSASRRLVVTVRHGCSVARLA